MTPAAAREREIALQVFSKTEVLTLEALADAIVPGAQKAGICHFLDHHLAQAAEDCLLMIKYMGLANEAYPDFTSFDKKSNYFDPKSTKENPRWFMVDVKFKKK